MALVVDRIHEKLDGMRDASKEELDEKVPGVGVQIMTASGMVLLLFIKKPCGALWNS